MNMYATRPEIDDAWRTVETRVDELPPALAAAGRRYLLTLGVADAAHPLGVAGEASPPLLHLPLWLRDRFRMEGRWSGTRGAEADLAVRAGVWGAMHVRIQGDLLAGGGRVDADLLLFDNICCAEMFSCLRAATASSRGFWPAFERAWTAFTSGTLEERRHLCGAELYQADLFATYAQKSAFARIPALAICYAAGRPDLEAPLCSLVQHVSVAFGLVNDVLGWPRDLEERRWTYLLARAGLSAGEVAAYSPAGAEERSVAAARIDRRLQRVLHDEGLWYDMSEEALRWLRRAVAAGAPLGLPELGVYTEERARWIRSVRRKLQDCGPQQAQAQASPSRPISSRMPVLARAAGDPH